MNEAVVGLGAVKAKIAAAEQAAGRAAGSVTLVAVSKTFEAPLIRPLLEAGHRVFGENRVQEAEGKWPGAQGRISRYRTAPDRPAAVQQGEAGSGAVRRHRDGRPRQDRRRARQGNRAARQVARGSTCRSTPVRSRRRPASSRAKPSPLSRAAATTHGLSIDGLMCIPPADENPGPHFALLEKLAREAGVDEAVDGHVRRLRARRRLRRDQRARRLGDLRRPLDPHDDFGHRGTPGALGPFAASSIKEPTASSRASWPQASISWIRPMSSRRCIGTDPRPGRPRRGQFNAARTRR